MKAFDSFRFLKGTVRLFLGDMGVLLVRNPRWGRVELNFLPIMPKKAYVGPPLRGNLSRSYVGNTSTNSQSRSWISAGCCSGGKELLRVRITA